MRYAAFAIKPNPNMGDSLRRDYANTTAMIFGAAPSFEEIMASIMGAMLALMLFKVDLNIISIIGIVLLIGIVKKNAIMMIDFALEAERQG